MDPEAAVTDLQPLLLFFDCEAAAGNVFRHDIIEVAVKCQPDLHPTAEFDSLIHTDQRIGSFGQENGLTARVLEGQPTFPEVLDQLLAWCSGVVEQVNTLTNCNHYPGRHRAMVDVQLLIKVFYETPLHQFLDTLPIFSTEEWYEFYQTKKEIQKDKREFGDKLLFLNEVERKFAVRSLVKNGLNYGGLKHLYQQCRSVEHFKQEMRDMMETNVKTLSIKKIADHFRCENLPQLGTIPKPKATTTTLVPRQGRSTIFDIDDVATSQGDHEKGLMKRPNTGMSFQKIKKELEKSTTVVRGKGARRRHICQERSKVDIGKKSEAGHKERQLGRDCSLRGKTSEKFVRTDETWRMPGQTRASRHESSEDRGERSNTRPPVSTYAQILTGTKTQEDDGNEVTCTAQESEGKVTRTRSLHKTQKKAEDSKTSKEDTNKQKSGWNKKQGKYWSGQKVQDGEPPWTPNRRRRKRWPDLFKSEHQHQHSEGKHFNSSPQQPKGEKESLAKGPCCRNGEKCRCGRHGKLPRSNFRKPERSIDQKPRNEENFVAKKNCSCGLPHGGDITKSNTTKMSQVVGAGRSSEPSAQPTRSKKEQRPPRPSSAKYDVLSTQDGRKNRDGPKDGRKNRDGPKDGRKRREGPKEDAEEDLDVSIEELLPFKNPAYKYLFTPVAEMDASTAEDFTRLIYLYNQEHFRHKETEAELTTPLWRKL
uniref:Exonuclease domain-containing protein n=1 Tax=Branchiostoma floridae TaxID=7739 RepID=C3Z5T0_BRAFL|eukprot:XP_002596181.1 hypothetical protein BRAFLDRAFT_118023 [Branchiostoma floridae]